MIDKFVFFYLGESSKIERCFRNLNDLIEDDRIKKLGYRKTVLYISIIFENYYITYT